MKLTHSLSTLFVAACLTLSGCVVTNASLLGTPNASRPKLLPNQVALYRIASQVPGKYEEVALLNSAGDSNFTDESKMFESMKKKAGELGANGVVLDAVSEPSAGAKVAAAIFGVSAQRKGKALAIYIFPDPVNHAATNSASGAPVASPQALPAPAATSASPDGTNAPQSQGSCIACAKISGGTL